MPFLVTRIWTEVKNFWKSKIILPSTVNNKLGGDDERFGYSIQKPVVNFEEKSFKSELFLAPLCQLWHIRLVHVLFVRYFGTLIWDDVTIIWDEIFSQFLNCSCEIYFEANLRLILL